MKKMYKQPSVEQAEMLTGSIVMAGSPAGIGAGTGNGTTGDIPGSGPIPGE